MPFLESQRMDTVIACMRQNLRLMPVAFSLQSMTERAKLLAGQAIEISITCRQMEENSEGIGEAQEQRKRRKGWGIGEDCREVMGN